MNMLIKIINLAIGTYPFGSKHDSNKDTLG